MKKEDKIKLLELLSEEKSVKMSVNVPVTDNYSNVYDVIIHSCNASTTNRLIKLGYSLFVKEIGVVVDKF